MCNDRETNACLGWKVYSLGEIGTAPMAEESCWHDTTHAYKKTLSQPNHAQTLDLKLFQWSHGCCNLLTTLQPMGNLVTTLCQGGNKLGRFYYLAMLSDFTEY